MTDAETPMLSLAAPAYNEAGGIEAVVRDWVRVLSGSGESFEIVVANDGSSDGTGEVLDRLAAEIPQLRVVHEKVNHGYGHAVSLAMKSAAGLYVASLDSDGQFDPADALSFLQKARQEGLDGVNGRRMGKKDSLIRVLADRVLNLIVRVLFGTRLSDTNCALKLIRRELLKELTLDARGYPFPTELVLKLEAKGAKIAEMPANHYERASGKSHLKVWDTGWKMLWFLLYLRLRLSLFKRGIIQRP
ncbi:MAG: glycosyltransferase family 2 protein [Deltaproteobacteria bacterium]|nr:glycosyltransferase family 2 protein [Deltaproteobacteria bacterium]